MPKGLFRSRGSRSQSSLPTPSPLTLEPSSSEAAAPSDPPAQPSQTTISPSLTAITTHDSPAPIGEGQNYGVQVLYDSGTEASVDIVFVHGLTSDAYNTWLHKNMRVHWPSQLLRQDIPDARILSFGYDADIVNFWNPASTGPLLPVLAFTTLAFAVLLSVMLPFAVLHRAISACAGFIILLFIYWKFHVTDGRNRSLFFVGLKCIPTSFPRLSTSAHPTSALYYFFPHSTTAKTHQSATGPSTYY